MDFSRLSALTRLLLVRFNQCRTDQHALLSSKLYTGVLLSLNGQGPSPGIVLSAGVSRTLHSGDIHPTYGCFFWIYE